MSSAFQSSKIDSSEKRVVQLGKRSAEREEIHRVFFHDYFVTMSKLPKAQTSRRYVNSTHLGTEQNTYIKLWSVKFISKDVNNLYKKFALRLLASTKKHPASQWAITRWFAKVTYAYFCCLCSPWRRLPRIVVTSCRSGRSGSALCQGSREQALLLLLRWQAPPRLLG